MCETAEESFKKAIDKLALGNDESQAIELTISELELSLGQMVENDKLVKERKQALLSMLKTELIHENVQKTLREIGRYDLVDFSPEEQTAYDKIPIDMDFSASDLHKMMAKGTIASTSPQFQFVGLKNTTTLFPVRPHNSSRKRYKPRR
ncbi:hypothetical protein DAMA08_029570 [Martiniozyma asiatica (nom. inval.)]|nr:hypothetical protein DAMA08_029570 [Martiniozyma asiatica]